MTNDQHARKALRNAMTRSNQWLERGDIDHAVATLRRGLRTVEHWQPGPGSSTR